MKTKAIPHHWLVDVATYAGVADLSLPPRPSIHALKTAWGRIAAAAGLSETELAKRISAHFKLEAANLEAAQPHAVKLLPEEVARRHGVVPIRATDTILVVATSDPADTVAEREIRFLSGRNVVFQVAPPGALLEVLDSRYSPDRFVEYVLGKLVDEVLSEEGRFVREMEPKLLAEMNQDASPVVRLARGILEQAAAAGATDVLMEPDGEGGRIRLRIDGVLQHFMDLPRSVLVRVTERVKALGGIDEGGRGRRARGQFYDELAGRSLDVRIAVTPMADEERVVLRLIDPRASFTLEALSLSSDEEKQLRNLLRLRGGIIVATGPARSGIVETLYALLGTVSADEVSALTLEHLVEHRIPGVSHTEFRLEQGTPYSAAVEALLEQSPDVLMVSAVPDADTAAALIKASMAGHLVLAGMQTDRAVSVVQRLEELGLDRPRIGTFLRGVIAQRVVRRLCPACVQQVGSADQLPPREARLAEMYRVVPRGWSGGCPDCRRTGFRGQIPVMEIMTVTASLAQSIAGGAALELIEREAIASGMRPLTHVALDRVKNGETTLQEVVRVLGSFAPPTPASRFSGRALVVDDNDMDRRLMRAVLSRLDFPVGEAADGAEGLEALAQHTDVSLVLLDLKMPRLGGLDVLRKMRASVRTAGIPVIVLTVSGDPRDEIQLLEAGADDYLRKPIDPESLTARVQAVLRRAGIQHQEKSTA